MRKDISRGKYSIYSALNVMARTESRKDQDIFPKACELQKASYCMAAGLLKLSPSLFEETANTLFTPTSYERSEVELSRDVLKEVAMKLMLDYGNDKWSLLSDKPARPAAKAAAPETLDA